MLTYIQLNKIIIIQTQNMKPKTRKYTTENTLEMLVCSQYMHD
jgi:hypothetical protein